MAKEISPLPQSVIGSKPEALVIPPTSLRDFMTRLFVQGEWKSQDMPRAIDLGEFDEIVNEIMDRTDSDPGQAEYATSLILDMNTKELSFTEPISGNEESVSHEVLTRDNQELAASIHSHGEYDIPFSRADLMNLFKSKERVFPPPIMIVATPKTKMLIARTEDTLGREFTGISPDIDSIQPNERMFSLNRFAQQYGFKIYSAPRDQRVLRLTS